MQLSRVFADPVTLILLLRFTFRTTCFSFMLLVTKQVHNLLVA